MKIEETSLRSGSRGPIVESISFRLRTRLLFRRSLPSSVLALLLQVPPFQSYFSNSLLWVRIALHVPFDVLSSSPSAFLI